MARTFKRYTTSIYEGIITSLINGNEVVMMKYHLNLPSMQQQLRRLRKDWPTGMGEGVVITYKPDPDNAENIILYLDKKVKTIPYTIKPKESKESKGSGAVQ